MLLAVSKMLYKDYLFFFPVQDPVKTQAVIFTCKVSLILLFLWHWLLGVVHVCHLSQEMSLFLGLSDISPSLDGNMFGKDSNMGDNVCLLLCHIRWH